MSRKRALVLGALVICLVLVGSIEARAQGNSDNRGSRIGATTLNFDYDGGGLSALRTYVASLIAQIEQSKLKIAQLEAALNSEISARQTGDSALQAAINGISGGGVTQATLDAAIAAEASTRALADQALEGQIANEAAARATLAGVVADLGDAVEPLASLAPLAPLATYVSIETGAINGLDGPHVIFTGANVHVRAGGGDSLSANGRGNLIVGYNELYYDGPAERGGSHNVVIGLGHRYNFATGFVAGYVNRLGDMAASVSGGAGNDAANFAASVTGGSNNRAIGSHSTVTAGDSNIAGDIDNVDGGVNSAVHGGSQNRASHDLSAVTGGAGKTTTGPLTVVVPVP
jgi:hypothetical protein